METKKIYWTASTVLVIVLAFLLGSYALEEDPDIVVREDSTRRETKKPASADSQYKVFLITIDQGSNYWQNVDAGCRQAAEELGGIDYHWIAPTVRSVDEQKKCIDRAVAEGAQAILISAASQTEVNENLRNAAKAGAKIVYVDSAATEKALATLMTDNEQAGRIAGATMRQALYEAGISSGTIGIVAMNRQAQNTILRIQGFRSIFQNTHFTVAPTIYMQADRQDVKDNVRVHPEYIGFFGANEQMTRAVSEQVWESGTKQIIIGFDTSDFTLSMIQEGVIYATMQQKPEKMGHDGLVLAVRALKGEFTATGSVTDTGVAVITKEQL